MSKVYATMSGFIGHAGQSVPINEGDEYDVSDPLVEAHPEHFTARSSSPAAEDKPKRRPGVLRG